MAEYIEKENAFNAILKLIPKVDDDGYCWIIRGDAARAVDALPAADVRPVVLCKDCDMYEARDYYEGGEKHICLLFKRQMQEADFCSYGEKREES